MEQKIEHETLPLKEEKQLLREIKQLKQFREQLSSNMGKQDELKEALEQKEQTEEGLKVLTFVSLACYHYVRTSKGCYGF